MTRRRGEVQIGIDPRWAVRVGGLDRAEAHMLEELTDLEEVPFEGLALRHGVDEARARELFRLLDEARVIAPAPAHRRGTDRPPVPARLGDDLQVHSLLARDADGAALLGARARRTVGIEELGRTGAVVASTLAAAGVGTLVLDDPRAVGPQEPGVGGLTERDVDRPMEAVVARVVTDVAPGITTRTGPWDDDAPDVVVLVDSYATDPERAHARREAGAAVLPVVVREADAVVGPLVAPRATPCLRCVGLHHADADPDWPVLVAQLCARGRRSPAPQVSVLAHLVGAFAASQVLAVLDGEVPATAGASYEFSLPQPIGRRREWSEHPGCECADHVPA